MKKTKKPMYWGNNAVRQAQRRFLHEKKTAKERENEALKAVADVFAICILAALYDLYDVGETRLERVSEAAGERAERYRRTKTGLPRLVDGKRKTGPELAEIDLERDVAGYFPPDFLLPLYKMPKKRDLERSCRQRAAAATVGKLYAYGMHEALGYGADRVARIMEEANANYEQFRDCADDGDYYGYALLARKMSQILHSPFDVVEDEAERPIFGKTID